MPERGTADKDSKYILPKCATQGGYQYEDQVFSKNKEEMRGKRQIVIYCAWSASSPLRSECARSHTRHGRHDERILARAGLPATTFNGWWTFADTSTIVLMLSTLRSVTARPPPATNGSRNMTSAPSFRLRNLGRIALLTIRYHRLVLRGN